MVGLETLDIFECKKLRNFFDEILKRELNSEFESSLELIKMLSFEQKKEFIKWVTENTQYETLVLLVSKTIDNLKLR